MKNTSGIVLLASLLIFSGNAAAQPLQAKWAVGQAGFCDGGEVTVYGFGGGLTPGAGASADVGAYASQLVRVAGITINTNCPYAYTVNLFLLPPLYPGWPVLPDQPYTVVSILVLQGKVDVLLDRVDLLDVGISGFIVGMGTAGPTAPYVAILDPATGQLSPAP